MRDLALPEMMRLSLRQVLPRLVPLVALAVFGGLFWNHLTALDGAAVRAALEELDRWLRTGVPPAAPGYAPPTR